MLKIPSSSSLTSELHKKEQYQASQTQATYHLLISKGLLINLDKRKRIWYIAEVEFEVLLLQISLNPKVLMPSIWRVESLHGKSNRIQQSNKSHQIDAKYYDCKQRTL
jgi:hypothetical protein